MIEPNPALCEILVDEIRSATETDVFGVDIDDVSKSNFDGYRLRLCSMRSLSFPENSVRANGVS